MKKVKLFNKQKTENECNTFQEWLKIIKIKDGNIYMKDGRILRVIKILPVNFNLKSHLEQAAILSSYKQFLKNLNSKTQIIISNKKTDISRHIEEILQNTNENSQMYEISQDYINLMNQIIYEKGMVTKEFYIVLTVNENIENEVLKIKEHLQGCGNSVFECNKAQVVELLKNFLNKRLMNS